nr:MAG TPA: hypothetical protein [Caudoviricetes sp.]
MLSCETTRKNKFSNHGKSQILSLLTFLIYRRPVDFVHFLYSLGS